MLATAEPGRWRDAFSSEWVQVGAALELEVPAHGVRVLLFGQPLTHPGLRERLADSMVRKNR